MFLSNYENKIDKKEGYQCQPLLSTSNSMGYNGFISYPSFNHSALEACSQDRIERLSNTIDSLNPFEEKRVILQLQFYQKVKIYNLILKEEFLFLKNYLNTQKLKTMFYSLAWAKHFKSGSLKILKNLKY